MGGVVRTITGEPSSGEKPSRENYGNPYSEDLLARFLAAMDEYKDRTSPGWRAYVPPEQAPYQWRPDEERAEIRGRELEQADEENRPARNLAINEPTTKTSEDMLADREESRSVQDSQAEQDQAFASAIEAARRGQLVNRRMFAADKYSASNNLASKKNELRDYIVRGRNGRF
jgi:hypothetical protein